MAEWKKRLLLLAKLLLVCAAFYFIFSIARANWEMIRQYEWRLDPANLAVSLALLIAAILMLIGGWYLILRTLGQRLPLADVAHIWMISQLGKYVPGHIWQFVGRIAFLAENGVSKRRGLLSLYIETAASLLGATLTLLVSMLFARESLPGVSLPMIVAAIACCLLSLHPRILELGINLLQLVLRQERLRVEYRFRHIVLLTSYYAGVWFVLSCSFFFLVRTFTTIGYDRLFSIAVAFIASYVLGFLAVFAPVGIGVREGFMILLLGQTLPQFMATIISIASRLWFVLGDVLSFGLVMLLCKALRRSPGKPLEAPDGGLGEGAPDP